MKRKVIQIVDHADTKRTRGCLLALCDDGTIWYMQDSKWNLIPEQIPQHDLPEAYNANTEREK